MCLGSSSSSSMQLNWLMLKIKSLRTTIASSPNMHADLKT
ncbi:unnamed protein product [Brassica oleracea]